MQTVQKSFFSVADFVSWQKSKTLELAPKFQRRPVWKKGTKSYLIDTIMRGYPIPIVFLRNRRTDVKSMEPIREVIDGQQRLRTVLSFVAPNILTDFKADRDLFTVNKTHNHSLAGRSFEDFTEEEKRTILDYEFSVHVLPSSMDDRQVVEMFRRMNSTNYKLNPQELRNAGYFGEFKSCAYKLAQEQYHKWLNWEVFDDNDVARMNEVEFTSECLLGMIEGDISGKNNKKLNNIYKNNDGVFAYRNEAESRFRFVINEIEAAFGKLTSFSLLNKRLIYSLWMAVYSHAFGLKPLSKNLTGKHLKKSQIETIKSVSNSISMRTAQKAVLEAADRRTTNPKERRILFNHLINSI